MLHNILIATDDSKAVHHAIKYAVRVFPKSCFHILSVINTSDRSVPQTNLIKADMKAAAERAVENARNLLISLGAQCVETSVKTGTPSREITRYINENDIGLLVITRTAKECAPHIGGTCLHVLELVHCPVLIVPSKTPLKKPESIFNPTSGSKYSLSASEMAVLLADIFNARIFALYVGKGKGDIALETVKNMADKMGVQFSGRTAKHPLDMDILASARKHDIMVFSRGYRGIRYKLSKLKKKMILGKLDREVIGDADLPLIIVSD